MTMLRFLPGVRVMLGRTGASWGPRRVAARGRARGVVYGALLANDHPRMSREEADRPAPATDEDLPVPRATPRGAALRFGILLAFLVTVFVLARWTPLGHYVTREELLAFLERVRESPASWVLFIGVYILGATLALPGSLLSLAGGAVFGLWPGYALNLAGSTLGATCAFFIGRYLGQDFVRHRLRGRIARLNRDTEHDGFRTLLLLRVVPLVPYNGLNYAAGLSHIRVRHFVLATALGILPGTFIYTYFADAIVAGSIQEEPGALLHMLSAALLLAALSLLPLAWRRYGGRNPAD
jgi:uncharacterized membrane protein YdjX (TVP38/TMEM64 family)